MICWPGPPSRCTLTLSPTPTPTHRPTPTLTLTRYKLLSSDARVHLLAGAIAATVSNTIVAPLDVIRLNIMVSETPLSALTGLGLGSPG